MEIDTETFPPCRLISRKFPWGEPYVVAEPVFDLDIPPGFSAFEYAMEFYFKNNFREQLLGFHNALVNFEEGQRLVNFSGEISPAKRQSILQRITQFLDTHKDAIAPWEKYQELSGELEYIRRLEEKWERKLVFIRMV